MSRHARLSLILTFLAACGAPPYAIDVESTRRAPFVAVPADARTRGRLLSRALPVPEIRLEPKPGYVAAMNQWNDPLYRKVVERLPEGTSVAEYVTSLDISARKR